MKLSMINEISIGDIRIGMPKPVAGCVYRGMCFDEWLDIKRSGIINSRGFNLYPEQRGGTVYGDLNSAIHFAIEVPVWNGETDYRGVLIEIPKREVVDHLADKRVHDGEYMHFGGLSADVISRAWLLIPNGNTVTIGARQYVPCVFKLIQI